MKPLTGEHLKRENLWGVLASSKFTQAWNLTSTYTELVEKIRHTFSTSTYNLNWFLPCTHTSTYSFNLRIQVRISSTGPCHVLQHVRIFQLVRTIHTSTYALLGASLLNTLNVCVLIYAFSCRFKILMRTYVTAIYRQDNRKRYLRYCGIAYLYQVLL